MRFACALEDRVRLFPSVFFTASGAQEVVGLLGEKLEGRAVHCKASEYQLSGIRALNENTIHLAAAL